ncbi:hypothetical protein [Algibacillus agarilyticus]|uniref:hypothetical protein n=1 Tax=Algibacillus agarilyticus TaxID=2234133 RepID=UPI000DD0136E|nr:hypothetical protein [Algibacillus agarilyticus]
MKIIRNSEPILDIITTSNYLLSAMSLMSESGVFTLYSGHDYGVFTRSNFNFWVNNEEVLKFLPDSGEFEHSSETPPKKIKKQICSSRRYIFSYYPNLRNKEGWIVVDSETNRFWDFKSQNGITQTGGEIIELDWKKSVSKLEFAKGKAWTYTYSKQWRPTSKNKVYTNSKRNDLIASLGSDRNPAGCPPDRVRLNGAIASLDLNDGTENWYYEFFHSIQDFYVHKDIIYVAHRNEVAALNAETGELIRDTQAGENYGNNIVWCDGNYAYLFNYSDEKAYLFDLELTQQLGILVFPNNFILNSQYHPYLVGDDIFIPVCSRRLAEYGVIRINRTQVLNDDIIEYVNEPEYTRTTVNNPDGTQSYQLTLKGDNADSVIRIGEVELRKIYTDFGASIYDGIDTRNSQFNAVVYIDMQIPESELGRFNELFETLKKRMEDWLDFMQVTSSAGKHPANIHYQLTTI